MYFLLGLCLREQGQERSCITYKQNDLTGLHDQRHTLASDIITKGKSPMITIGNMHQGYIFRVWSVVLLVVQCHRFCWCSFVVVVAYFASYTFLRVRGQEGEYAHTILCCCSCPMCACKGGWGYFEYCGENSYFTLEPNQSYITIHVKIGSIQINLKLPCTSCSDWQPRTMHVSIACFIALLLMLLLAKVKVEVFSAWPFSL